MNMNYNELPDKPDKMKPNSGRPLKDKQLRRDVLIRLKISPEENKILERRYEKSGAKCRTEFLVGLLLEQDFTTITHDDNLSDFLNELIKLKDENRKIGNNINQVVRKINSLMIGEENKLYKFVKEFNTEIRSLALNYIKIEKITSVLLNKVNIHLFTPKNK